VVALDNSGRPDFHRLQHYGAEQSRIQYFGFDLLVLNERDLTDLPLPERRKLLKSVKLLSSRLRISEQLDISADHMLTAVLRSGKWRFQRRLVIQRLTQCVESLRCILNAGTRHGQLIFLRGAREMRPKFPGVEHSVAHPPC
jgi:hypothetical protein